MHYRYLITFEKDKARESRDARIYAFDYLTEHGIDASSKNYFEYDGHIIGGRWSGELSEQTWAKGLFADMAAVEEKHAIEVRGHFYSDWFARWKQRKAEATLDHMWKHTAPDEYVGIPANRSPYEKLGYADDAMIINDELYDALLANYEGFPFIGGDYVDAEGDAVSRDFIDKKWLVVVDYHC